MVLSNRDRGGSDMPKPENYQDVDQRVHEFWERFPEGRIATVLHSIDADRVIFRADVWKARDWFNRDLPDATGWAEERFEGRMEKWAVETCETSALGRSLANLGLNAKGLRPSSLEMGKADRQAPAAHSDHPDYPIIPALAKRELLAACGGDTDRARDIWGDRADGDMNRAELDGLLAKVDA